MMRDGRGELEHRTRSAHSLDRNWFQDNSDALVAGWCKNQRGAL